jgi:enamine deaminase RidA (YjgF/YER057c/UK114 family)
MTSEEIWKCVVFIKSYHVRWTKDRGVFMSNMVKKYMGDARPAGTGVGIESLAFPDCLVEIEVKAAIPGLG